jgi:CBS domain containing-hemolysin-like protein
MIAAGGMGVVVDITGWTLVAMMGLFALSFFFSGTETALYSLQSVDRQALSRGTYGDRLVARMLGKNGRALNQSILIGNETVNVALAATTASVVAHFLPGYAWANVFILTPLLVLISEITPKVLARRYKRRWATLTIWPLTAFFLLVYVPRLLFSGIVYVIGYGFGARGAWDSERMDEAEFIVLVEKGTEHGHIDPMARDIVEAVFEFDDLTVERVMTPRPDVQMLPIDLSWDELLERSRKLNHSRIPMYADNPDNIVGVLLVKDLLKHRTRPLAGPRQLRSILLPASFVPASKATDSMLQEFLTRRFHMALVVDEHGTLTGLVTLDDLLDELVGELEPDIDDVEIARTSPNSLTVKAAMDIEDFTEETGITLPEGDYHTLGGFVFHEFGRLPRRGDFITYEDHKFIVHEMAGRRIGALRVVGGPTREVS